MTTTATRISDEKEALKIEEHDFGVRDQKGRLIGGRVYTGVHEFVPTAEKGCFYTRPAGRYFYYRVSATRNGKAFGAYQGHNYYIAESERNLAVAAYLKNAKRRATKIWAAAKVE